MPGFYTFNPIGSSASRPPSNQPVPSLDRAVAFGTAFERPLPGSTAADQQVPLAPRAWGSNQAASSSAPPGARKPAAREGGGLTFRKITHTTGSSKAEGSSQSSPKSAGAVGSPWSFAPGSGASGSASTGGSTKSFRAINGLGASASVPLPPVVITGSGGEGMPLPSGPVRVTVADMDLTYPKGRDRPRPRSSSKRPSSSSDVEETAKRAGSESAPGQGQSASSKKKKKKRKQKAAQAAAAAAAANAASTAPAPDDDDDDIFVIDSSITTPVNRSEAVSIEQTLAKVAAAAKGNLVSPRGPLTPTNSNAQLVPGSGSLSTPSGTISAPISITTTASGLSATSTHPVVASDSSKPATSANPSPQTSKKIFEVELSDDDDDHVEVESDAESILEMELITISSSEEEGEDEMDVSGDSSRGGRSTKRKRQEREKPPPKSKKSADGSVYYSGKVEIARAGVEIGVGVARIITDGKGGFELRLRLKKEDAGLETITGSKAQLRDAELQEDKRMITWRADGTIYAATFLETGPWIQFSRAFTVTLKSHRTPTPIPSTSRMSVAPSPAKRTSPTKMPTEATSPNLSVSSSKRPAAGQSPQASPAKVHLKKGESSPKSAPTGKAAIAPSEPLEPRKIKPPARYESDWPTLATDDGTDGELPPRPKKKLKTKAAPLAPPPKKTLDKTRIEEIVNSAVNAVKEPAPVGRFAKAIVPSTEFTIEVLQCNIGTGKIPLSMTGSLPKQVCVTITAEMASNASYTKDVTRLKEELYYPDVSFDPNGKKIMTFDPPLSFHLPAPMFRTLPQEWPFLRDRGYRKGHYVRLKIDFLSFVDSKKEASQWILDEFGGHNVNQDDKVKHFQCPYAEVPLIRPHKSGEMDRQVSTSSRAQLSIGGMELNPEFSFSFKYQAYWDAAAAANAPELPPLRKERPPFKQAGATTSRAPTAAVQQAKVDAKRKRKGRLVLDDEEEEDEESCAEALGGLEIATNDAGTEPSDESPENTPQERSMSPFDEVDIERNLVKQAFTMVFEPTAPTFRLSPARSVPKSSQQLQQGTLAHDLASLDREAVDNEIIEREEAIFDIEGIHDGQKFVMALWNRWCSTFGRIHHYNSDPHIHGFINRYFTVMFQRNVRRYLVIHLQVLSAFDLCQNDTFASALAQYSRLTQQVLKQSGALKPVTT